jgi:hypothetical protein
MQANQVVDGIVDSETVGAVEWKKFGREKTKADWTISEPRLKPSLKKDTFLSLLDKRERFTVVRINHLFRCRCKKIS